MKLTRIIVSVWIFTLLAIAPLAAQDDEQGGTESLFKAGFGARASGLGQAYTALAEDPSAVFWNPAGLEYVYQQSVMLFHMSLFEGTNYDFLAYAVPTLKVGTFAIGIARLGIGGIEERSDSKVKLRTFDWETYQAYLSYAKKIMWDITAGASIKVLRTDWGSRANEGALVDHGVGMDLGLMWRPKIFEGAFLQNWSLGLNIRNLFAPQLNEGVEVDVLPLSVRFGIMKQIPFSGIGGLNVLFDLDYSQQRDMLFHFGAEYSFMDMGMVRVGYDGNGVTFGAGIAYKFMQLDYAYTNSTYGDYFPAVHKISLSFNFGLNRDQLFEIAEAERKAEEARVIADMRERDRQKFIAEHLKKAEDFFDNGEMFNAIVEYQQVIGQDPFNQKANMMLDSANVLLNKEFERRQELAVQNALDNERAQQDKEFIQEHFQKARLLLDKNQFTEALIEFNMALERDPQNETIKAGIATTKRRMAEETTRLITQARQQFQKGNYSEALRLLADARILGGDDQRIQSEIEPLVKRIKLQEKIQKGLGLYEIGEYDKALKLFEEALAIDPKDELVKQYYERSKIESSTTEEQMDPDSERKYLIGVDHFVKGEYRQAVKIWEEVAKKHPYNKKLLKALKGARDRLKKME